VLKIDLIAVMLNAILVVLALLGI